MELRGQLLIAIASWPFFSPMEATLPRPFAREVELIRSSLGNDAIHRKICIEQRNSSEVYAPKHAGTIELAHKALARLHRPYNMDVGHTAFLFGS